MTEEEKVIQIQTSPKENGEGELIEEVLETYSTVIKRIARSRQIMACRLDPEDVEQQLRIRLWRAIEFWPGKGSFRAYANKTLSNAAKNCSQMAHVGGSRVSHFSVPLHEQEKNLRVNMDRIDDILTAQQTLERLVKELEKRKQGRLAQAVRLLSQGKSENYVSVLLEFSTEEMLPEIRQWAKKILQEEKWQI